MRPVGIPDAIREAQAEGKWRDPGPGALRAIFSAIPALPDMELFEPDLMHRVPEMMRSGGYVGLPHFCMVEHARELSGPDDPRLALERALFLAGSVAPGEDVLAAVENVADGDQSYVVVFDWTRHPPARWVRVLSVGAFCTAIRRLADGRTRSATDS